MSKVTDKYVPASQVEVHEHEDKVGKRRRAVCKTGPGQRLGKETLAGAVRASDEDFSALFFSAAL